ncbi:MAG: hypothetical protein ACYTG7_21755 [Planctomycetota bacterium]
MNSGKRETTPPGAKDPAAPDALSEAYFRDQNVAEAQPRVGASRGEILRRLAKYILPLFILLGGIDVGVRVLFPKGKLLPYMEPAPAYYIMKLELFEKTPAPDVLLIGSSRMRHAGHSRVLSMALTQYWGRPVKVFNMGLQGAMAEEYFSIIEGHLPDPPPPYVIIGFSGSAAVEVHRFSFASRFLWDASSLISYIRRTSFADFEVRHVEYFIEGLLGRLWYAFDQRVPLSKLLMEKTRSWLGLAEGEKDPKEMEKTRMTDPVMVLAEDGYPIFPTKIPTLQEQIKKDPKHVKKKRREFIRKDPSLYSEASIELIQLIVDDLRAKGCKVAFVETTPSPYLINRNKVLHGEGFREWMADAAEKADVLFIPMPWEEMGLTNAFFKDPSHMLPSGAAKFTFHMFKKLRDAGFFEEGRQ